MIAQSDISVFTVITAPTEKRSERRERQQAQNAGYRRLACAIVDQAARDAQYLPRGKDPAIIRKRTVTAIEARAWLAGPACAELLESLGIERGAVLAWLATLPPVQEVKA